VRLEAVVLNRLLGCDAVSMGELSTEEAINVCLLGLIADAENGGNSFLRDVGEVLAD
jgi:hypothetical protein